MTDPAEPIVSIALAGAPNAGKSSLFNRLTGGHQKIGNYPGVTVEKKSGVFHTPAGHTIELVDLPGTYSLDAQSEDERIAVESLFLSGDARPRAILVVLDASNLERGLGLVFELARLEQPVLVALNMMDLALKRGLKLDRERLEAELGCPVIPTIAVHKWGVKALLRGIDLLVDKSNKAPPVDPLERLRAMEFSVNAIVERSLQVDRLLETVVLEPTRADRFSASLDRVLLHPILGLPILLLVLLLVFESVFTWAAIPMDGIEWAVATLGAALSSLLPEGVLRDLLTEGIIGGVGSVVVFLPQILILFAFILVLEGSGYMARASFILNRMMALVGLQGQAAVPLLTSFACAIPGIMAARTIKSPRERLITMMIAPLMTCSARLPVYTLLVGAFVPAATVAGLFDLRGVVMLGLFVVAVLCGLVVAWVLGRVAVGGRPAPFVMDLPTYKVPSLLQIGLGLWIRAKFFLKRAGTLILGISVVLWTLSTYPKPVDDDPSLSPAQAIQGSYAGQLGLAIEPLIAPLGFDWRIATGLVPGFAAREVMVGALGTVFAVEDAEESGLSTLQDRLRHAWGLPTALALLAWYIFAPQCLATFAVLRRESGSWKWTALTFVYMLGLAYVFAFLTYQVASLFM